MPNLFQIFATGLCVCIVLADEKYMWNRHVWDIPIPKLAAAGQIAMAAKLLFTLASFFTRQSLLCFYYRLVSDSGMQKFRIALHISNLFNLCVCISFIFLTIFQCIPVKAYWIYPPSGNCSDEGKTTLGAGVINCVADLLITTLPIPMVMRLKMRSRQRLAVVSLLALGFIVTIAGIVRTFFIWIAFMASYDETWFSYPLWIAAAVEIDLAVITACAPSLRPLIATYARPLVTSISKRSRAGTQEPSGEASRQLDFGSQGRGAKNGKALETIEMEQIAESASDSSQAAILLIEAAPLSTDEADAIAGDGKHDSISRSMKSGRSLHRSIHVRQSSDILHSDVPIPARQQPPPTTPPRTPPRSERPPESPFAQAGHLSSMYGSRRGTPEPDQEIRGKRSREWNWPLREELISRYASTPASEGHSSIAPKELNLKPAGIERLGESVE